MKNNKEKQYEEASKAIAGMMFVTELAYEIAVRFTPLIKANSVVFKQGLKNDINRFQQLLKQYNCWMVSATKDAHRLEIIRFISEELNDFAYEEVHKLMICIKNHFDKIKVEHSETLSRIEILYYLLTLANINANRHIETIQKSFPAVKQFQPMSLSNQLRLLSDLRKSVIEKYVKDIVIKEDTAQMIESGLVAIMREITDHSNEVCQRARVEV